MLTNEHYKNFLRLNNRKGSHAVIDYLKNGYFVVELPRDTKPINDEMVEWLNHNCGRYKWTSDQWSLLAFTTKEDSVQFCLTWEAEMLDMGLCEAKYGW